MALKGFRGARAPAIVVSIILTLAGLVGLLSLRSNDIEGPRDTVTETQPAEGDKRVMRMIDDAVAALNDADAITSTVNMAAIRDMIDAAPAAAAVRSRTQRFVGSGHDGLCELVETAAAIHGLPTDFFSRLLWQESSFRPDAVSPVGALGIAQFMPVTAAERGLKDPLDPGQAIPASADFLSDLVERFGNLGLAAAAYNAGPRRVWEWIAGTGPMPAETSHYVAKITGRTVEYWRDQMRRGADKKAEQPAPACMEVVAELAAPEPETQVAAADTVHRLEPPSGEQLTSTAALMADPETELASVAPGYDAVPAPEPQPWGVELAADYSEARALGSYKELQKQYPEILASREPLILRQRNPGMGTREMVNIRVAVETRAAADALCGKLRDAGGACSVLKN